MKVIKEGRQISFKSANPFSVKNTATITENRVERTTNLYVRTINREENGFSYESNVPLFGNKRYVKKVDKNTINLPNKNIYFDSDTNTVFITSLNKGISFLQKNSPSKYIYRIVRNGGALEFYHKEKTWFFFTKEVLAAKLFKTEFGYSYFLKGFFGFKRTDIHVNSKSIEIKSGFSNRYFRLKQ